MAEKKYFEIEEIAEGRKDTNCPNCKNEIQTYNDNIEPDDETLIYASHGITITRVDAVFYCEHCDAELEMTEIFVTGENCNEAVSERAWRLTGFYLQGNRIESEDKE